MGDQSVHGLYVLITGKETLQGLFGNKIEQTPEGMFIDSGVEIVNSSNYKELIPKE
jgi:hypothetical protein